MAETRDDRNGSQVRCSCNSGRYCRIHRRYYSNGTSDKDRECRDSEDNQRCGGGRRVIRKTIEGI